MAKPHRTIHPLTPQSIARFKQKIDRSGNTGCWNWTSAISHTGYGLFTYRNENRYAHRVAYFLSTGNDPGNKLVCHTCDNRLCCNPDHLFLGSAADNTKDMFNKGRNPVPAPPTGSQCKNTHLTEPDIISIRDQRKRGATLKSLAEQYGVSKSAICRITRGNRWKHILQPSNGPHPPAG